MQFLGSAGWDRGRVGPWGAASSRAGLTWGAVTATHWRPRPAVVTRARSGASPGPERAELRAWRWGCAWGLFAGASCKVTPGGREGSGPAAAVQCGGTSTLHRPRARRPARLLPPGDAGSRPAPRLL